MTKWTKTEPVIGRPGPGPGLSAYQRAMRDRLLAAPVVPAPEPWRRIAHAPVGGLLGIGFASHPRTGHDLVMAVSHDGHGLFDAVTGERIARDRDPDPDDRGRDADPAASCPGLGPVAGRRVRVAGLFGGGLHTTSDGGWKLETVAPAWPNERVLLSRDGGLPHDGPHGEGWWHVFHSHYSELRAAGFSPSGQTFAVATSSDLSLWTRCAGLGGAADA
ncbi:hypothetical protein GCM10010503_22330 [Streptomyces lucensis JCM 4490]|uniref:Uncharacterized protein n=1 Tax=Streptomyces lucensis JCM 4490 TaxID=1306176 RepID=A0A918J2W9_9ACTN|nr:hypothetical protein [Streptomyces lucensis]GGW44891.1 hypothetical protein GCM10010503_22330 [Streptomyces lucensis JCM 4490]